jgi:DNA sulfur modification protein DndD
MPLIKYMKMKNFYNYYGENCYDFKKGINIVVADNNGGKSKLYNAFLWAICDKIFDSDKRDYQVLDNDKDIFKLISDKKKFEADLDDIIETSVELSFITDLDNSNYGPTEYIIKKKIKAEKISEENPYLDDDWKIYPIEYYCEKIQGSKKYEGKFIDDYKKISRILIPTALQKYFMFQGEEVDNLVNGKELTNAMNHMTELWMYDYFEQYLLDIKKNAENKKNDTLKNNAKNKEKAQKYLNNIDALNKTIDITTEELKNYKNQEEEKNNKLNQFEKKLYDYNMQNENLKQMTKIEQKIEDENIKINKFEKFYNNNFFKNKWILEGFDKKVSLFYEMRYDYQKCVEEEKRNEAFFNNPLPQGSPDISSLKLMLENEKCLVCGRKAEKNTEEYNHIKNIYENYVSIKNNHDKVSSIRYFIDDLFKCSDNIPESELIKAFKQKKAEEYQSMKDNIKELSEKFEEFKMQEIFEMDKIERFISEHQECKSELNKLRAKVIDINNKLESAEKELKNKQTSLEALSTIDNSVDNEKVEILLDLYEVFKNTKSKYYHDLSEKLETAINDIYQSLTKGNETNPGVVSVYVNENYHFMSELLNSEGGLLSGQGAAFQRMRQLAIVMGILKMDNQRCYPLIADAPISEMGEILANNFFYEINPLFEQSIILVKDFYTQENGLGKINSFGEELIADKYLNPKVYLNRAKGKNQQERETEILLIHEGNN